jgi:pSer/pThr/pTyr-binding forkhead associated (FHA) protein
MTTPAEAGSPPPAGAGPGATRVDAGGLLRRAALGEAAQAGPHLVVREPRARERVVALAAGCTVGRGRLAALRLADPSASRLHLRLRLDAAGATVHDLGSRNGLRVNGGRARGRRRLRSGDELEVGETLLRYVDPLESCGGAPGRPALARPWPRPAGLLAGAAGLLLVAALALALG